MYSPYDVRNAYPSRHTKAEGKFTPQICRSRIFVPANECTRVVPMYPSQSAMSHLHSLAQSMYIATFLPEHVLTTCFADDVTSTSGAIRLAFDLLPLASSRLRAPLRSIDRRGEWAAAQCDHAADGFGRATRPEATGPAGRVRGTRSIHSGGHTCERERAERADREVVRRKGRVMEVEEIVTLKKMKALMLFF